MGILKIYKYNVAMPDFIYYSDGYEQVPVCWYRNLSKM